MNRNVKKNIWVTKRESDDLHRKAQSCCLSEAEFIRQLIAGYIPVPQPDQKFYQAMDVIENMAAQIHRVAAKMKSPEDRIAIMKEAHNWQRLRNAIEKHYLRPQKANTDSPIRAGSPGRGGAD